MLYIENHDHPRMVSRYGSEKFQQESAKMLAASYLFQKGTPFIYQGQEIGMTNWYPKDPLMYEDVQTRWQYFNVATNKSDEKRLQRLWHGSRDSARTPVQWSGEENAGFTTGTPWFYVNENYKQINVRDQEQDEHSVLNFYRRAVQLRKSLSCVRHGDYKEYGKMSSKLYTYSREDDRQKILVVCSFAGKNVKFKAPAGFELKNAELLLHNYEQSTPDVLKPYETRVYLWKK
jgi:oligo-1,6-glucosidase